MLTLFKIIFEGFLIIGTLVCFFSSLALIIYSLFLFIMDDRILQPVIYIVLACFLMGLCCKLLDR